MKKKIIYFNLILLILMQLDVLAQNNMQKDNADLIAELGLIQIEIETIKTENLELTNSVSRLNELSTDLELKNNLLIKDCFYELNNVN